ncbi:unnamed protein product [Schistosoma curassoni]|nr:unnamed protein product [Schistosoma curassoni]
MDPKVVHFAEELSVYGSKFVFIILKKVYLKQTYYFYLGIMTNKLLPFDSRQIICNEESKLSGLSVCLPSQISTFDQHSATIYSVTGASRNPFSEYEENLSCKISKRFHCPVFVSISLPHEFAPLWNHFNVITQSTLGQKAEHCIFENLSTILLS